VVFWKGSHLAAMSEKPNLFRRGIRADNYRTLVFTRFVRAKMLGGVVCS